MTDKKSSSLSRPEMIDLGIRALLGVFFALWAGICFRQAFGELQTVDFSTPNAHAFSHALSVLAIGLYTLMVACLYALRLRAQNRAAGAFPCAAAILGGFLMSALLLLNPRPDLPLIVQVVACLLVLAGNGFAVYILLHLGRSFSILPESRKLVTSGPYQMIRHPLYLAEAVSTLGALIVFLSPWAFALVIVQIALQLVRIHYEEKTLSESFPEYKDYARKTWRLIPGIY